jgi:hypothetical protein
MQGRNAMAAKLKICKIGNSAGLVLPREVVEPLRERIAANSRKHCR